MWNGIRNKRLCIISLKNKNTIWNDLKWSWIKKVEKKQKVVEVSSCTNPDIDVSMVKLV